MTAVQHSVSMRFLIITLFLLVFVSCSEKKKKTIETKTTPEFVKTIESVTFYKDTLYSATVKPGKAYDAFKEAKANYMKNPNDIDAVIWYGRRTAYLGQYKKAVSIYTEGIEKHPNEARLYRHRGHRYLTTRQYDKAIADFEKAAILIEGKEDTSEKDGIINSRNIQLTTLHGNIWYHLGLAHYLKNDMEKALTYFSKRKVAHIYDDNIVSSGHWVYMINRRLGNVEAANIALEKVKPDMDIIENMAYHKMCLFYKDSSVLPERNEEEEGYNSITGSPILYGLANWNLYHKQDTIKAKYYYDILLKKGMPYSFGYLAAEVDMKKLNNPKR